MQFVWEYCAFHCQHRLAGVLAINPGDPRGANHAGVHLCKPTAVGHTSRVYSTTDSRVTSLHAALTVISLSQAYPTMLSRISPSFRSCRGVMLTLCQRNSGPGSWFSRSFGAAPKSPLKSLAGGAHSDGS